jgi:hypothetical protein
MEAQALPEYVAACWSGVGYVYKATRQPVGRSVVNQMNIARSAALEA